MAVTASVATPLLDLQGGFADANAAQILPLPHAGEGIRGWGGTGSISPSRRESRSGRGPRTPREWRVRRRDVWTCKRGADTASLPSPGFSSATWLRQDREDPSSPGGGGGPDCGVRGLLRGPRPTFPCALRSPARTWGRVGESAGKDGGAAPFHQPPPPPSPGRRRVAGEEPTIPWPCPGCAAPAASACPCRPSSPRSPPTGCSWGPFP